MMNISTLKQIFDVLSYTRENYNEGYSIERSYRHAVQKVANHYNVTYQTIGDACRRRLELDHISDFFKLLNMCFSGDANPLIDQIKRNTPESNHYFVDEYFKSAINNSNFIKDDKNISESIEYRVKLSLKESRMLKAIAELEGKNFMDCLSEILSQSIKNKFTEITRNLLNT
jgi:hypothetical protein